MLRIICTLLLFISLRSFAQNDTIFLQPAEVSGTRIPTEFSAANRSVTVISREDIASMPASTLDEVLEYALNADVRQRGTPGAQSDISIRGGSYEQLAILLNGVRINDPQTGHHNLNIPLDLSCVDRIEILQGPGTRMYGPGAFSGAINIVTSVADGKGVRAQAEGGDFRYMNGNLTMHAGSESLKSMVSTGYRNTAGYRYNTDLRSGNVFWFGQHLSKAGTLTAQAGYNNKQFGANSFYSPLYPDQFEQTRAMVTSIQFASSGKFHFRPQVYYRRHQDRYELFRNFQNAASWYTGHNYHLTHVAGAEISSWFEWMGGKTSFGGDYRYESVFSNKLGEMMENPIPVPMEGDAVFTRSKAREVATLYADHQWSQQGWNLSGGMMLYYNEATGFRYFPGIDMSYSLNTQWQIFSSYNHSIRLPSFTEMFYTAPTHQGNSFLLPEEAMNTEAGIRYSKTGIQGSFACYYRNGKNIIDWIRNSSAEKWQTANITSLHTLGTETDLKIYLPHFIRKSPVQVIRGNIVWNLSQKATESRFSLYALDYIRCKATGSVSHTIWKDISATWSVQWQQREGTYTSPNGNEETYPEFTAFDGRIAWKTGSVQLYAEATNLFNSDYFDIGNLPMPGRWFKGGLILNFSKKKLKT